MRGFWYTLEAVIAGIILIGFLAGIGFHSSDNSLETKAFEILKGLDEQQLLRQKALSDDYSGLNALINTTYNHMIEICDADCVGEKQNAKNVFVGRYFISGNSFKEVRLYLW